MQIIKSLAVAFSMAGLISALPTGENTPQAAANSMVKRLPHDKRHYLIGVYGADGEELWSGDLPSSESKRSETVEKRHYLIGVYGADGEELWSGDLPSSESKRSETVEKRHYLIGVYGADGEELWSGDLPTADTKA